MDRTAAAALSRAGLPVAPGIMTIVRRPQHARGARMEHRAGRSGAKRRPGALRGLITTGWSQVAETGSDFALDLT